MNKIKTIGLVFDSRNKEARKAVFETAEWLKEKGITAAVYSSREDIGGRLDLVATFGGDGTVLHVANKVLKQQTPILRVNFGTVGALCNVNKDDVYPALSRVLKGDCRIEEKTRICAELERKGAFVADASNEILVGGIHYGVKTSWLAVEFGEGREKRIYQSTGDGLIFSTEGGSTAWNLSAGGPQLLCDTFCLTGSNAFFKSEAGELLKTKSFVVPTETVFKVKTLRSGPFCPYVLVDGQTWLRFRKDDTLIVKKSPYKTLFIELEI